MLNCMVSLRQRRHRLSAARLLCSNSDKVR